MAPATVSTVTKCTLSTAPRNCISPKAVQRGHSPLYNYLIFPHGFQTIVPWPFLLKHQALNHVHRFWVCKLKGCSRQVITTVASQYYCTPKCLGMSWSNKFSNCLLKIAQNLSGGQRPGATRRGQGKLWDTTHGRNAMSSVPSLMLQKQVWATRSTQLSSKKDWQPRFLLRLPSTTMSTTGEPPEAERVFRL